MLIRNEFWNCEKPKSTPNPGIFYFSFFYKSIILFKDKGNSVDNIVITSYGARWVLEILKRSLCKVYDYLITMLYT